MTRAGGEGGGKVVFVAALTGIDAVKKQRFVPKPNVDRK
jgi:hypothetical protein